MASGENTGLRSSVGVVDDVQVTDRRENESVLESDTVGEDSNGERNRGTANDRHDEQAGTVARERAEFRDAQSEDAGEHYRVEQADQDDAPHGKMAVTQHREADKRARADGGDAQQRARAYPAQDGGTEEAAHHRAEPVGRQIAGRGALRNIADVGLGEIVDQEAAIETSAPT